MFWWKVVAVLTLGFMCQRNGVKGQKHHWTNVSKYMDVLCRFHDVCKIESDDDVVNKKIDFHCCKPCSCLSTCGLTESCCYPELDMHNLVDRSHQECIVPVISTQQSNDLVKTDTNTAYNMVVDSHPLRGCVKSSGIVTRCGDDETATPFGSLYPVFSKKTGRVYKNIKCAKCHGLLDTDVIVWNSVLSCKHIDNNSSVSLNINTFLQILQNWKVPPTCAIAFSYPEDSTDLQKEKCYTHSVKECPPDFNIPSKLDMTKSEVEDACLSDFNSPYFHYGLFANVFCYICSSKLPIQYIHYRCQEDDDRSVISKFSFINILPAEFIEKISQSSMVSRHDAQLVCRTKKGKAECRDLECPNGQIYIGLGKCIYPDGDMTAAEIVTALQLRPTTAMHVSKIRSITGNYTLMDDATFIDSPWGKYPVDRPFSYVANNETEMIEYILVVVALESEKLFRLKELVEYVDKTMSRLWYIHFPDGSVELEQTFSLFNSLSGIITRRHFTNLPFIDDNHLPVFLVNVSLPYLHNIAISMTNEVLTINKMFFCNQITLKPEEYELFKPAKILYYKELNQIFYNNEYSLVYNTTIRDYVPRICLSDTDFILKSSSPPQNNNCSLMLFSNIFLFGLLTFHK